MTPHQAYSVIKQSREPLAKWVIAKLLGTQRSDGALLRFETENLLLWEDDNGRIGAFSHDELR